MLLMQWLWAFLFFLFYFFGLIFLSKVWEQKMNGNRAVGHDIPD